MPRKDPSFSDSDIIRIYCENLTDEEKDNVDLFFYVYRPLVAGLPALLTIIERQVKDPRTRIIISLIARLFDIIFSLSPTVLRKAIPNRIEKVVIRCLFDGG